MMRSVSRRSVALTCADSYYKQARCGDAPPNESLSPWTSVVDRAKHSSWSRRRGIPRAAAAAKYVAIVEELRSADGDSASKPPALKVGASFGSEAERAKVTALPSHRPLACSHRPLACSQVNALLEQHQRQSSMAEQALRARIVELETELARVVQTLPTRGWLHKYAPSHASWLGSAAFETKWERRFFVLAGAGGGKTELLYYRTEHDAQPRRRIPLSNCVVVDEGRKRTKLRGSFRIFSLWCALLTCPSRTTLALESSHCPGSGALLRLSCASEARPSHIAFSHALLTPPGQWEHSRASAALDPAPCFVSPAHQKYAAVYRTPYLIN